MRKLVAAITLGCFALTACSGSGNNWTPPAGNPLQTRVAQQTLVAPRSTERGSRHKVRVTLHIDWKGKRHRRAHYLPASARSISFTVNGGHTQYANFPASTIYVDAPVGYDSFFIAAFDEHNGLGNVLAKANVSQQVVLGSRNVISATLNGVIASFGISLGNPSPNAGTPATIPILVSAYDADGNLIVGSTSDYSTPISLSISDPSKSGTLSLSRKVLQGPWATANLVYNGGTIASGLPDGPTALIIASVSYYSTVSAAFSPTPTVYQYAMPTASHKPQWIAAGPDGNMWFTETANNIVGRITPAGVVTEFTVPTLNASPAQIISASDGNLWFTESANNVNKIAKVTTAGTFTEFSTLFAPPPQDNPMGIVDRGDGNVWYVANGSSRVGFVSYNGSQAGETSVPTGSSGPFSIATSPDNYLYYTESNVDKIGRVHDLFTSQSEISLTSNSIPRQIVRGPDGNLWFTESGTGKIGQLNPFCFCVVAEYNTVTQQAAPTGITVGKDGALWFTEQGQPLSVVDRIGRVTTGGSVSDYSVGLSGLSLQGIAVASDGSLWFCEPGSSPATPGRIGRLVY